MSTDTQTLQMEPMRYPEQDPKLTSGRFKDLLTIVGPGFILASTTIGNGEIFSATRGGSIFAYALIWTFLLGAVMKAAVVYAGGRYIVLTGEHPFARFGHVLPGGSKGISKHWFASFMGVLAAVCFPAWIVAYILAMAQWTPWSFNIGDGEPQLWMGIAWGVLAWLTLFVRDFSMIEKFQTIIVLVMVVFSLIAVVVAQPDWLAVFKGFLPTVPSAYPDWVVADYPKVASRTIPLEVISYLGALGGGVYDYIGYLGTFREKTWGMLGRPDNAELNLKLQALDPKKPFPIAMDEENLGRSAAGVKAAKIDTVVSFIAVAIFAVTFMILGTVILGTNHSIPNDTNILKDQAAFFTLIHPSLKYLYQLAIWAAFWGSMQALITVSYPYTIREAFAPAFPALNDPKNWFKVRTAVATYTFGVAVILAITNVSYTTAISFAGILGGVFALGLWGLIQLRVEAATLPPELRMKPTMRIIVLISSAVMLVMGLIALWQFFANLFS